MLSPRVTELEYIRSALFNALHSDLTIRDVCEAIRHAQTGRDFDDAIRKLDLAKEESE